MSVQKLFFFILVVVLIYFFFYAFILKFVWGKILGVIYFQIYFYFDLWDSSVIFDQEFSEYFSISVSVYFSDV